MAGLSIVATLLMVLASTGGSAAWSHTVPAPYTGQSNVGASYPSYSNYTLSGPAFNFTTGVGSFNESAWGTATNLGTGAVSRGHLKTSALEFGPFFTDYLWIDFPFLNHSGTRLLHSVNITIDYAMTANYSFAPGACPWVATTKKTNECSAGADAGAFILPDTLDFAHARKGFTAYVSCTSGCTRSDILNLSVGAGFEEKNTSKGSKYTGSKGASSGSLNVSGSLTYEFLLSRPEARSGILSLSFEEQLGAFVEFTAKDGAGGLHGASGYAAMSFSIPSVHIVES